jgi:transposase
MRGEVLGLERRRRWDDEVKLAIVSAVVVDGATVTQVAQRHEVTRQQIYVWRHELKRKGLWSPDDGALFLPAGMVPAMELTAVEDRTSATTPVVWVEVRLAK